MRRPFLDLTDLELMATFVPALCAGLYEALRHSVLQDKLSPVLGTVLGMGVVLALSYTFARVTFGTIRRTEARLRQRNRQLETLSREVESLAVLKERERLSREIHDGVAQALASWLVRLDTVERLAERGRVEDLAREVKELRAAGGEAYEDVREAIADLRTRPGPGPLGLRAALADYVGQFAERTGIASQFAAADLNGEEQELAPAAEVQLFRIVQEALANVRKHSGAKSVRVSFWAEADGWHVRVQDDGTGFQMAPSAPSGPGRHLGLQIMHERAESVGGALEVLSQPGQGTVVLARVPRAPKSSHSERPAELLAPSETDQREDLQRAPVPTAAR